MSDDKKDRRTAVADDGRELEIISKKEAKELGLKKYFTGKTCKQGHMSERYTSVGDCVECQKKVSLKYYHNNSKTCIQRVSNYNQKNKEKYASYQKEYQKQNKEVLMKKGNKRRRERYNEDENVKLRDLLRGRLYKALQHKDINKCESAISLVGCSIEFLRDYIEEQFEDWMSWENHGHDTWHIDHIRPCTSFDLTDPEQQKACFHYTNLAPLGARDNVVKGAKYNGIDYRYR